MDRSELDGDDAEVELIPAIDLRGGRVVRLVRGELERATVYAEDPVAQARSWEEQGAARLHLVDLDGAVAGAPAQAGLIRRIVVAVNVPCQVSGGLRDERAVARALESGSDRVVMGTALLAEPRLAARLVRDHGSARIVAGLDVRGGTAVGDGWVRGASGRPFEDALRSLHDAGIEWFVVTSIAQDGTLDGPDLRLLESARTTAPGAQVIASGGIGSLDDIRRLGEAGFPAVILGRALYDGRFSLAEAIATSSAGVRSARSNSG